MQTRPFIMMRLLLLLTSLASAALAQLSSCQCLTSYPGSVSPSDGVTIGGATFFYPATYGLSTCAPHDSNLAPVCNGATPPAWCSNRWCYVDRTQCSLPAVASSYFPGTTLYYSYTTCGSTNTFTNWFGAEAGSGSGESHVLGDIVTVIHNYLISLTNTLEENEPEMRGVSTCTAPGSSCPCNTCSSTTAESRFWTNTSWSSASDVPTGATISSFDFATVSLTSRGNAESRDGVLETCLAGFLDNAFMRVAAREAAIDERVGYEYAGFQAQGTYVQWPSTSWCPSSYDPRFRSWYVSAASGPKDVVIVLDVSGSMMQQGRLALMQQASRKLLDTFSEVDYIGMVAFSSSATNALGSTALIQATPANVALLKSWVNGLSAQGTTNFVAAFNNAFALLTASNGVSGSSSMCTKAILFLSDGVPNPEPNPEDVRSRSQTLGGVKIFTYALGSGAQTNKLKRYSCMNEGALWTISDGGNLGDAMADYYTFLAPLQQPCQVRWTYYEDWATGAPLLAACLATFKKDDPALATSCAAGTVGCMPELLGVACMDVSVIATQATLSARSDSATFYDRVRTDQTACYPVTPTLGQLQALRARISFGNAVCSAQEMGVSSAPAAASCVRVAGVNTPGYPPGMAPPAAPVGSGGNSLSGESDAPVGAIVGAAVGGIVLLAGLFYFCKMANKPRGPAFPQNSAVSSSSQSSSSVQAYPTPAYQQPNQYANQPVPVVQAVAVAVPAYNQGAVPMGKAVDY